MKPENPRSKLEKIWNFAKCSENNYWLTRFLLLRILGFTYLSAFLSLINQLKPLLGSEGLTPVKSFLPEYTGLSQFMELPTVFWFNQSDQFMMALASTGLLISFLLMIGFANVPMLLLNWFIYLSFVNVGQIWYGYGWEMQLLETGFLAIFLVPLLNPRPFSRKLRPPPLIIWLFRWLTLRIHLGSGLIKVKGVECWQKLTCLERFYQTQPIPNPLSPWMHQLPLPLKKFGALYTHFVQLTVPYSGILENNYGQLRNWGGVLMLSLQIILILTGNFAFLNWVTVVAIISFFDDRFLSRFMPELLIEKVERAKENAAEISEIRHGINILLVTVLAISSIPIVMNLLSPQQAMNTSMNNWHFIGSYGAFGSVRPERTELVMEGTNTSNLQNPEWKEYDFRHKPDQVDDPLTQIAPYQPRIAWQMWFASFSQPEREPWLLHLTWKLLENDPQALKLVKENPFKKKPPKYIRIRIYEYKLEEPWEKDNWNRRLIGTWMQPISKNNTRLERYIERRY